MNPAWSFPIGISNVITHFFEINLFTFFRLSPVGVMFLVTSKLIEIKDISQIVGQLGLYFVTVLLGLTIHGFVTLSVIFFVCTRELPFKSIRKMGQVIVTAFGTASR